MRLTLLLFIGLLISASLFAQDRPHVKPPRVEFSDVEEEPAATVWVFLNTTCPVSIVEAPYIKALRDSFGDKGVRFVGVFSGEYADTSEIEDFLLKYHLTFPILYDKNLLAANSLGADVTPQVVIVLPDESVVYKGRINNLFERIGKRRNHVTSNDARDVLQSIVDRKIPQYRSTDAVGCFIER
ncbi:hypothetical protein BH10BAC6_BH10BAC6_06050 [soil metagenome]